RSYGDWSSDVCSSELQSAVPRNQLAQLGFAAVIAVGDEQTLQVQIEVAQRQVGAGTLGQIVFDLVIPHLLGRLDLDWHPKVIHRAEERRVGKEWRSRR